MSQPNETLLAEITNDTAHPGPPDAPDAATKQAPANGRLSRRFVTVGLALLAALLLTFFMGMRYLENRADQWKPPEETAAQPAAPDDAEKSSPGVININTATRDELESLPGIGKVKAQAIIDYRNEYGPFFTIEEITRVDGVGEGIFRNIKNRICVR